MSERFVEGFAASIARLDALRGTPEVGFAAIKKLIGRRPIFEDLMMTIGDGDDDDGITEATAGLDAIAAGKRPKVTYVERLAQLVLHAHAEPLRPSPMEANFMPAAEDDGLWNPAFAALGMKTIAKQWGRPNLAFPHAKSKVDFGWPVITVVEPASLVHWKAELATPWRDRLAALPLSTFDPDAKDDGEPAFMDRDEVAAGIAVLEKWVAKASGAIVSKRKAVAPKGNALVLVIDGDQ